MLSPKKLIFKFLSSTVFTSFPYQTKSLPLIVMKKGYKINPKCYLPDKLCPEFLMCIFVILAFIFKQITAKRGIKIQKVAGKNVILGCLCTVREMVSFWLKGTEIKAKQATHKITTITFLLTLGIKPLTVLQDK